MGHRQRRCGPDRESGHRASNWQVKMGSCLITFQSSALTWPPAPRSTTLCSPLGGRRVMDFGEVIGFGVPPRPGFWIGPADQRRWVPRDAYRVRGTRQGCRAGTLPGQRSALMPKCSMNHASGPGTTQAITAPSCVTPTATTSKPFAAPPDSDRRRARRHLPLPTTVRLLQARAEPERG
jgi:hypothetical protein